MDRSSRPAIRPELVAHLIDQAPSRVRKRLDKNPTIADTWDWSSDATSVSIMAGEETVRLELSGESNTLVNDQQVSCSCLLSPKCFHLLACASILPIAQPGPPGQGHSDSASQSGPSTDTATIEITDAMRDAARRGLDAIDATLRSGARRCGVVLQSSLLRAAHQCRAEGLINLSAAILRVVEGVVRLRAASDNADAVTLQSDLALAVAIASRLSVDPSTTIETIGQVRRTFRPVPVSRLVSLVAEPIVTRSGYAGICVYLLADDRQIYQVSEVRPGEADLASQVYRGGFDLGATTLSAMEFCRGSVDVQNMTASPEGRLGRGSKTRWALRKRSDDSLRGSDAPAWQSLFEPSPAEQVERVFRRHETEGALNGDETDFVGFDCEILGGQNDSVMVALAGVSRPISLRIALDTDQVVYRENLQLLSRSPGLKLFVLGRLRRNQAGSVDALMIRIRQSDSVSDGSPRLELPESWQNSCQLGLDRLERHFFSQTDHDPDERLHPSIKTFQGGHNSPVGLIPSLQRQQLSLVLGGRGSVASPGSQGHRRMIRNLRQGLLPTAAKLADAVASTASASDSASPIAGRVVQHPPLCELFAATHWYQSKFRSEYHRQAWRDWLS